MSTSTRDELPWQKLASDPAEWDSGPAKRLRALADTNLVGHVTSDTNEVKAKTATPPSDMEKIAMISQLYQHVALVHKSDHDSNHQGAKATRMLAQALRRQVVESVEGMITKYHLDISPADELIELLGLNPRLVEWATRTLRPMSPHEKREQKKFLNLLRENGYDPLDFGFSPSSTDPDFQETLEQTSDKYKTLKFNEESGLIEKDNRPDPFKRPDINVVDNDVDCDPPNPNHGVPNAKFTPGVKSKMGVSPVKLIPATKPSFASDGSGGPAPGFEWETISMDADEMRASIKPKSIPE